MPRHTISEDLKLKACIPALHYDGYKIQQICDILAVKKSLVYKTLALFSNHGVGNPHKNSRASGRPRTLGQADLNFLQAAIDRRHTIYIDELQQELFSKRGIHASFSTLTRAVKRLHITPKIVTAPAPEQNEMLRALYMNRIGAKAPDANMLLFVNGSSAKDERTPFRKYGQAIQHQCFIQGTRYTILPALTLDDIIAYDIIEGPVTGKRFIQFLEDHVMPFTTPYPGPRSVLVMDSCSIHCGEEVRKLVEDMNLCKLIFLPPYSLDYNPVEHAFSSIEAYLHCYHEDKNLMAMVRACQSITPDHAAGYFRASGYI